MIGYHQRAWFFISRRNLVIEVGLRTSSKRIGC